MAHPQRKPRPSNYDETASVARDFTPHAEIASEPQSAPAECNARESEVPVIASDGLEPGSFLRPLLAAAVAATGLGLLVHFTGWLITSAIVAALVGALAYLMNGQLDDTIDL